MRIFRSFEDDAQRISSKRYYRPNVEIKNYKVMIDGKRFFDQPINNDKRYFTKRSENIKLLPVKEIFIQLVLYWIVLISKKAIKRSQQI